jgi:membrane-associated protease RseP (regulator of RpoE activity)
MTGGLIVLLGVVSMVMIHEAGHFFAAKAVGMKATEFFFGFGPKLWSTKKGETEYGIKAIPLGGYVRIVGMNPYEEVEATDEGRTYREKPFWAKAVVVLAGVASHFVVAFLIFFLVHTVIGLREVTTTVGELTATLDDGRPSPAVLAGLQPGDTIVAVDGVETPTWGELVDEISGRPGESAALTVQRDEAVLDVAVTFAAVDDSSGGKRGFLGVAGERTTLRVGPIAGFVDAGASLGNAIVLSADGMWQLVTGLPDLLEATLSGGDTTSEARPASPIGLVQIGADTQDLGISFTLQLVALVNVFVALFNLLPVYPLDGGHFSVALYERIRGREADVRKLAPIAAAVVAFMVLLGGLAIYLDIADPLRLR